MNKKQKILTASLTATIAVVAIVLPTVLCTQCIKPKTTSSTEEKEKQLTNLWTSVNNCIIENHITVATDSRDANWNYEKQKIVNTIKNFELDNNKLLEEYFTGTITRNLASISFKLNVSTSEIEPLNLYDGYIVVDSDGTVHLNNLALSSPDAYFNFENGNREVIKGQPLLGQKEPNILIPYGTKKILRINQNAFPDKGELSSNPVLKNFIIPDTVQFLDDSFLLMSRTLEYVRLPYNLKEIPMFAFYNCNNLKEIKMYYSINNIRKYAFFDTSLYDINGTKENIVLSENIKKIEEAAFGAELSGLNDYKTFKTWAVNFGVSIWKKRQNIAAIYLMSENIESLQFNTFLEIPRTTKVYVKNDEVKQQIITTCIKNCKPFPGSWTISENQIVVNQNME